MGRLLATLAVLSTGCETLPTSQVTVLVRSDLTLGTDVTHLRLQTMHPSSEGTGEDRIIEVGAMTGDGLPVSFGIVPAEGRVDQRLRVVATGLRAEDTGEGQVLHPRVRAQAITTFRDQFNGELTMFLARNCWDVLCVPGGAAGDAIADQACNPDVGACDEIPEYEELDEFGSDPQEVEVPGQQVLFHPCEAFGAIKSGRPTRSVGHGLINELDVPISTTWIDYEGSLPPVRRFPADPGGQTGGITSPEHPWMVRDEGGDCRFIYVPLLDDSNVVLTPELFSGVPTQGSVAVEVRGAQSSLELLVNSGRSEPAVLEGDGSYELPGVYVLEVNTPPPGQSCTLTPSPPFDPLWFTRPRQTPMAGALIECE
ncbi:MAG: hypothetical protein OXR73_36800 [Myxococcales bacterium]|nr:hypothetical protein [Myxococcales bacterium]